MPKEKIIKHDDGSRIVMIENGSRLKIISTFIPEELRGKGRAAELMEEALKYAKEKKLEVVPICSYAVQYMQKRQNRA